MLRWKQINTNGLVVAQIHNIEFGEEIFQLDDLTWSALNLYYGNLDCRKARP